jgi:uncharacterized protein YndB with AHSA1/START domain
MPANPVKLLKLKPTGYQFIQEIPIEAPPKTVWKTVLNIGKWFSFPGRPEKHTLEAFPGGRWHSSWADGTEDLHGIVTRIEPGRLLRITGHVGQSHLPVQNVVIFELQPKDDGKSTLLRLCHRSYGFIDGDAKKRFRGGWNQLLPNIKTLAEK